jgi:hypothetical protein
MKSAAGKALRVEDLKEMEDINARLTEIRTRFDELKQKRVEIGQQIEDGRTHRLTKWMGKSPRCASRGGRGRRRPSK